MTQAWEAFKATPTGTKVFNHGYAQCVAVANLMNESVLGLPFVPVDSAYEWWTRRWAIGTLADNYTSSATPVAGAIVVWSGAGWNAEHGHIGAVLEVFSDGSFLTLEQNTGPKTQVTYRFRRSVHDAGLRGFLVPNNNPAASAPAPRKDSDMASIIRTDKGDTFVVDHNQKTYWNVHEGIPLRMVPERIAWLNAQGMVELHGLQPASLISGYTWVDAGKGPQADTTAIAQRVAADVLEGLGEGVKIDASALARETAKAVNDDAAKRMQG